MHILNSHMQTSPLSKLVGERAIARCNPICDRGCYDDVIEDKVVILTPKYDG